MSSPQEIDPARRSRIVVNIDNSGPGPKGAPVRRKGIGCGKILGIAGIIVLLVFVVVACIDRRCGPTQ
jgi:hypothetical protein